MSCLHPYITSYEKAEEIKELELKYDFCFAKDEKPISQSVLSHCMKEIQKNYYELVILRKQTKASELKQSAYLGNYEKMISFYRKQHIELF